MAFLSTATTLVSVGSGLASKIGSLFRGGSDCNEEINRKKQELAQLISKLTTRAERISLVRNMESFRRGGSEGSITANPSDMADFFYGESDCKHKNVSPNDQEFLDRLPVFLQEKQKQLEQQRIRRDQGSGSPMQSNRLALPIISLLLFTLTR